MKAFRDMGIKPQHQLFVGDKIKISKVLNCEITVSDFSVSDSKYPKNKSGKLLTLQIELNREPHVVFTGSDVLLDQIGQVQKEDFPFLATIVQNGEHFEFR